MNNFNDNLQKEIEDIENIIYSYCPEEKDMQKTIMEAMNYSVKSGGKRLRPMLLLETLKLFGGNEQDAYPFMAALEMIHTYSLVHDDLPAMDNDDYRRGRKTAHKVFGEDMAILAGDALLNYAYEIMSESVVKADNVKQTARAMQIIAKKAGIYGMVGGQTVDVLSEGRKIDLETINFIHDLKTAALIEAAMMSGAILAGAQDCDVYKIEQIAKCVGVAFQIQDDILDVTSTMEELGKPTMSDEKNNKTTYVSLLGVEKAKMQVVEYSKKALNLLNSLDNKNEFLSELIFKLINRKK